MFAGRIGMLSKARADEARGFAVWIPVEDLDGSVSVSRSSCRIKVEAKSSARVVGSMVTGCLIAALKVVARRGGDRLNGFRVLPISLHVFRMFVGVYALLVILLLWILLLWVLRTACPSTSIVHVSYPQSSSMSVAVMILGD